MKIMLDIYIISIHAPRAGCDKSALQPAYLYIDFNPRTPCGVRLALGVFFFVAGVFQSTHPVRGATLGYNFRIAGWNNFNPRTPCGVRLDAVKAAGVGGVISIHAPRAGCDSGRGGAYAS